MPSSHSVRAALLYAAAAVLITWPLAIQLTTRLGALEGGGDPYLNLWILGWDLHAWTSDPAGVFSGRVFDASIFYPAPGTLTYSDHLLLQALVLTPVYALTHDVALCYNLLLIGSLVASALAMCLLVHSLTANRTAALIAGLAWGFWPYRSAQMLHLQLQSLYFLPLALYAFHRVAAARRWRDAALLGAAAALQAISSVYYGVMTIVAVGVSAVAQGWVSGQWRGRRYWLTIGGGAVIAAVLVAPVAWPYWQTQQREGFGRNAYEASQHAAAIRSYGQAPPENLIYGRTGLMPLRTPAPGERDIRHVENQLFPGVLLPVLAAIGLWRGWKTDAKAVVA